MRLEKRYNMVILNAVVIQYSDTVIACYSPVLCFQQLKLYASVAGWDRQPSPPRYSTCLYYRKKLHSLHAGGGYFPNWRAGYTNIAAGSSYISSWNQNIPALGMLIGDNIFSLAVEDVTPSPYNQPPYPPSGDTGTANCTVTGVAPR